MWRAVWGVGVRPRRMRARVGRSAFMPGSSVAPTPSAEHAQAMGLQALREQRPLQPGPAVVLQVPHAHRERVLSRVQEQHLAGSALFEEPVHKNDTSCVLYRTANLNSLIDSVLGDLTLCARLCRMPFIAERCTEDFAELLAAFSAVCTVAEEAGDSVKLSAPASIRRRLLDAVLSGPCAASANACLVTTGETRVFYVASICRCAAFLFSAAAAPANAVPRESLLLATQRLSLLPPGHWHPAVTVACRRQDENPAAAPEAAVLDSGSCSRASFKLSEALAEEPSFLSMLVHATPAPVCIDIGASPGGWTAVLAHFGRVVAIDPGALDPSVAALPNVTHLVTLLSAEGDSLCRVRSAMLPATRASFVCCDANIPPAESGRLIAVLAAAQLLEIGCKLVLTLKAPIKVRRAAAEAIRANLRCEAITALGAGFGDVRTRHAFTNTQHETTLTAVYHGTTDRASELLEVGSRA